MPIMQARVGPEMIVCLIKVDTRLYGGQDPPDVRGGEYELGEN